MRNKNKEKRSTARSLFEQHTTLEGSTEEQLDSSNDPSSSGNEVRRHKHHLSRTGQKKSELNTERFSSFESECAMKRIPPSLQMPTKRLYEINDVFLPDVQLQPWQEAAGDHYSSKFVENFKKHYPLITFINQNIPSGAAVHGKKHSAFFEISGEKSQGNEFMTLSKPEKLFNMVQIKANKALLKTSGDTCEECEPLFLSIAVYDVEEKSKISESFTTEINKETILNACGIQQLAEHPPVCEAEFLVPEITKENYRNFYAVIRVFRIFIGDVDRDLNLYRKNDTSALLELRGKVKEQMDKFMQQAAIQPYFWTYFPLFNDQQELLQEFKADTAFQSKDDLSEESIFETIAGKGKNAKTVAVSINCTLGLVWDYENKYIPQEHLMSDSSSKRPGSNFLRRTTSVWSKNNVMAPFLPYKVLPSKVVNDLYIYPEELSLGVTSNVAISFQIIKTKDIESGSAMPLRCCYNRSFLVNAKLPNARGVLSSAFSYDGLTITVHGEKVFSFGGDEVKLSIPVNFSEYCLTATLFTMDPSSERRGILGNIAMKLGETSIIPDKTYSLAVNEGICFVLSQEGAAKKSKKYLSFKTKLVSTVTPHNQDLDSFFLSNTKKNRSENSFLPLNKNIKCSTSEIVKFFREIMRVLLSACTSDIKEKKKMDAFLSIFNLLRQICDQEVISSNMLFKYLETSYDPEEFKHTKVEQKGQDEGASASDVKSSSSGTKETTTTVHSALIHCWGVYIKRKLKDKNGDVHTIENCHSLWFVLGLIEKSITIELVRKSEAGERHIADKKTSKKFAKIIEWVLFTVADLFASNNLVFTEYNFSLVARMISKSLLIFERGPLFDVLHNFTSAVFAKKEYIQNNAINQIVMKQLLAALLSNEYFVQLNAPQENPETVITSLATDNFVYAYPLCGLLVKYLATIIPNISFRTQVVPKQHAAIPIEALKQFLFQVAQNRLFKGRAVQESIAFMVFPYFDMFISNHMVLTSQEGISVSNECIQCFYHILKYSTDATLLRWWDQASVTQRSKFFSVLGKITPLVFVKLKEVNTATRVFRLVLENRKSDFNSELPTLFTSLISDILLLLFNVEESNIAMIFPLLEFIFEHHTSTFFTNSTLRSLFEDIIFNLLCYMNADDEKTHCQASHLLYTALKCSLSSNISLEVLRPLISIAAERLNGEDLFTTDVMIKSLDFISDRLRADLDAEPCDASKKILEDTDHILKHITTLVKNYDTYSKTKNEETIYAIYLNTAERYQDSCTLMTTWVTNLYWKLLESSSYEKYTEAAQCQIHLAYIYLQLLAQKQETRLTLPSFELIAPNIGKNLVPKINDSTLSDKNELSVVQALQDAVECFDKAGEYEMALRTTSFITEICLQREYKDKMSANAAAISTLTQKYYDSDKKKVRLFPKYFRVAFYAGENVKTALKEIDGKKFIYKKRPNDGLKGMTDEMVAFLSEPFKDTDQKCEPVLVPNTATEVAPGPDQVMFQLAFVEPYCTDKSKRTQSEQYWGVNVFVNEQGITEQEGSSLRYQKKKRTFYTTEYKTPFVINRFPIVEERSVIVTPIENAIDMIVGHSNRLIMQMERTPKQNLMQQVLQGIIMPMVNEGIPKVCEMFLGSPSSDLAEMQRQLKLSFEVCRLMNLTGYGLQFFRTKFIDPSCQKLHSVLQLKFAELCKKVSPFIKSQHKIMDQKEFLCWEHYTKLPVYNNQ